MDSTLSQRGSRHSLNHRSASSCLHQLPRPAPASEGHLVTAPRRADALKKSTQGHWRTEATTADFACPPPPHFPQQSLTSCDSPTLSFTALGCALFHFPVRNTATLSKCHESSPRSNGHSARQETLHARPRRGSWPPQLSSARWSSWHEVRAKLPAELSARPSASRTYCPVHPHTGSAG